MLGGASDLVIRDVEPFDRLVVRQRLATPNVNFSERQKSILRTATMWSFYHETRLKETASVLLEDCGSAFASGDRRSACSLGD